MDAALKQESVETSVLNDLLYKCEDSRSTAEFTRAECDFAGWVDSNLTVSIREGACARGSERWRRPRGARIRRMGSDAVTGQHPLPESLQTGLGMPGEYKGSRSIYRWRRETGHE